MTMSTSSTADRGATHYDDVVGVEVTIDGMLVIADRLHLVDFPISLGIRPNIPQLDLREIVWDQVGRDLTAQGVLNAYGDPHPEVAAMVDTLSRPDRLLEGRWWRRDRGGNMVRFVVARNPNGALEVAVPLSSPGDRAGRPCRRSYVRATAEIASCSDCLSACSCAEKTVT